MRKMVSLRNCVWLVILVTILKEVSFVRTEKKAAVRMFLNKEPRQKAVPGARDRVEDSAERLQDQKNLQKSLEKKYKFVKKGTEWQNSKCYKLQLLMKRKHFAAKKINEAINNLVKNTQLPAGDVEYRVKTLKVFQAELDDSERLTYEVLEWLQQALQGNYKDFAKIKKSSEKRLKMLRDVMLSEEQMFNILTEAEKLQQEQKEKAQQSNHTQVEGILSGILSEVAHAADRLERDLDDHVFENAMKGNAQDKGANIEAVIRLREDDESNTNSSDKSGALKLVDAHDNQYVLAKGQDSTIPVEDHHFIEDVICLTLLATLFGWLCSLVQLPNMFGYILSGVVLGPSGLGYIKSVVQVETLGEFGVFFILFCVGLEFSPEKLKRVFRIASIGSFMMMTVTVLCGVLIGHFTKSEPNESAFISACLSLSSTPLVVKFMSSGKDNDDKETGSVEVTTETQRSCRRQDLDYSPVLIGILVMQDILLGVLIALLPAIAGHQGTQHISAHDMVLEYLHIGVKLIASFIAITMLTIVLARFCIGPLYKYLLGRGNREMSMLATLVLAFTMLTLTNFLNISMELGCFLAGAIVSTQGHHVTEQVNKLVVSVKDFLGCLFFASIGLHVFPTFLAFEITILTTFTLAVVGFKFFSSSAILHFLLPKNAVQVKWIVSAGLAQVSEFSFVLGCRARRLGLISREVYLLILSITTLSLLFAPVLWYATLWHLRLMTVVSGRRRRHSEESEGSVTRDDDCSRLLDEIVLTSALHPDKANGVVNIGHKS